MRLITIFILVAFSLISTAQNTVIDVSLLKKNILENPSDTALLGKLQRAVFEARKTIPEDSLNAYCTFLYERSVAIAYNPGIGFAGVVLGNAYNSSGDYTKALYYLFGAEKAFKQLNRPERLARTYNVIGNTYLGLGNIPEQKKYFTWCYEISLKNNLSEPEALGAAGLASCYSSEKNYEEANKWNFIAEKLFLKQKYVIGYVIVRENIADNYCQMQKYDKALEYSALAEKDLSEANFNYASYGCFKGKGIILQKMGRNQEAFDAFKIALDYILKDKANHNIAEIYQLLSGASHKLGKNEEALEFLNLHIQYKDSVFNENSQKQLLDLEKKYETEKKDTEIKILNKENDLNKSELKQRNILIYSASVILLMLVVMVVFITRSNVRKNRINKLLARQKIIIEEKQKEILDSIHYAKRIQDALFAQQELINEYFGSNFIYFNPKDIISGDFYWAQKKDDLLFLAVCDSTGHGVPGAFMSLLNIGFINEAVNEKGLTSPEKIFSYVRQRLINSISKEGQSDGFDGVLLCFDKGKNRITYACANASPLLASIGKIIMLPKDKMPVGKGAHETDFNLYEIDYKSGDMLYLFTDGYADQFGGPDGKKFKYRNLAEFILKISGEELFYQKELLDKKFIEWRGDLEQIDDVCVIGMRL